MSTFKRCLLGSSIFLAFVTAASAQTDWHGFYAGGTLGEALGRATANTTTVLRFSGYFDPASVDDVARAGRQTLNAHAFSGGLEAGVNSQSGHLVFGAESDYESFRLSSSQSSSLPYTCCSPSSFAIDQSYDTRWLFTARPRVGAAFGPALFYATAGLAVTKVKYQEEFSDTFANASASAFDDEAKAGFAAGLGAAYKLPSTHLSVKGEYLYTDFGRITFASNNLTAFIDPGAFPSSVFTHSIALHGHVMRLGVDYHW